MEEKAISSPCPGGDNRAQIARVGRGRSYANEDPPD